MPAGTFDALRVDEEFFYKAGGSSKRTHWYALDIGPVKWKDDEGRRQVLKEFKPGKK